jgi:hypothetical protein
MESERKEHLKPKIKAMREEMIDSLGLPRQGIGKKVQEKLCDDLPRRVHNNIKLGRRL